MGIYTVAAKPRSIHHRAAEVGRRAPSRVASVAAIALSGSIAVLAVWAAAAPLAMADSPADAARPTVATLEVRGSTVAAGLEFDGTLQAVHQSTVAAQVSGNVVQRLVRAGEAVRAGQALARIDERDTQAGLARSDAAVAQARAEAADAQAAFERSRQLVARGFLSQAALDAAQARLSVAQASERQAQAGRSQAALARQFATVAAPYDGLVLATHVEAGDLAVPGRAIATVYAPQPIRAIVHVPASQQEAVRTARSIEVRLPSGDWVVPVSSAGLPGVDPVSQTVEFRLDLPAVRTDGVVPGQSVRVRFARASATRLTIPETSVLRRGELTAVYLARADGFVLRAVRLGASHGDAGIEVLAGLAQGDRIAVDPVRAGLSAAVPAAPTR